MELSRLSADAGVEARALRPTGFRGNPWGVRLLVVVSAMFLPACEAQPQAGLERELQRSAEQVLPRLEALSGLPRLAPIAIGVRSRSQLRQFVETRLAEDFPPSEIAGVHATYSALGLIPEDIDLHALLLDLYTEQIVGFYDPARDTLFVVNDVPREQLETVLVHELVHALQDQHANLEALVDPSLSTDRQRAAQAALEGHATLVMVAWAMESMGVDASALPELPDLSALLGPALQSAQFPVLSTAPRIIRESLLFPYFEGARFVQALWRHAPPEGRSSGASRAPLDEFLPASTEQIRNPADRFFGVRDEPTEVRFGSDSEGGWPVIYQNTFGELELAILLGELLGERYEDLVYGWDGDRYLTFRVPGGGIGLEIAIVWDDGASADAFASAYERVAPEWSARAVRVDRTRQDGREVVRIVDLPAHAADEPFPDRRLLLDSGTDR